MEGKDSSKLLTTLLGLEKLQFNCDNDELLMNEKEEEMFESQAKGVHLFEGSDIFNLKALFTDRSLQLVQEEKSELEESILERLKAENEEVMKSYSGMIDIISDMKDKCKR